MTPEQRKAVRERLETPLPDAVECERTLQSETDLRAALDHIDKLEKQVAEAAKIIEGYRTEHNYTKSWEPVAAEWLRDYREGERG